MKQSYIDIGHGMHCFHSVLWTAAVRKIETHSAASGTHESVWGRSVENHWRGRYDKEEKLLSIIPPVKSKSKMTPSWLLYALEDEFGSDVQPVEYNPQGKRM